MSLTKNSPIGYIVTQELKPMCLGRDGVLGFGAEATLFPTRADALKAARRTYNYSVKHGFRWHEWGEYRPVRVKWAKKQEVHP